MTEELNRRSVTVFEGATIVTGDGSGPRPTTLIVADGMIESVGEGAASNHAAGSRIDLRGTFVIPALLDAHGHVGYLKGSTTSQDNYSKANVLDHLRRLAYYGVSTIQSLGTDRADTEIQIRNSQRSGEHEDTELATLLTAGVGIAAPTPGSTNGGPFFATDVVREASSAEEARAIVRELSTKRPDVIKFWVDDRDGTKAKLTPDIYQAIVSEATQLGLRSVAHIYQLDDAKGAVQAGASALAHMVRSPADPQLCDLMIERGTVGFTSMAVQRGDMFGLDWLDDDALAETVRPRDRSSVAEVIRGAQQRNSDTFRRTTYEALEQNLRLYEESGVTWVLSGDTGVISTFPGFAEHRELEAIVAAGIDPLRAISAATGDTAEFLHLPDRGTLTPGKRADFIVLDSDPIANISNTRKIRSVYLRGTQLDRKRMSAEFVG